MDKIANAIITLKNGGIAKKETVQIPYTLYMKNIMKALLDAQYISAYDKKSRKKGGDILEVTLSYDERGNHKIHDVLRMSKLSRRLYTGVKEIVKIKEGYGRVILSTPKGIMTGEQARAEHVGGEVLFQIW